MDSCKKNHWGEFDEETVKEDDFNIPPSDLNDLLTPEYTLPCVSDFTSINKEETSKLKILPPEMCRSAPLVMHNIKLIDHCHRLSQHASRIQTYGAESSVLPQLPEDISIENKMSHGKFLNYVRPETTEFTRGEKKLPELDIDAATAKLMLRKAIATILADTGFADGKDSVLRLLTDCTVDFYNRLTSALRINTDTLLSTHNDTSNGYEIIRKSFHSVGITNVPADIHNMYKNLVNKHAKIKSKTETLQQLCEARLRSLIPRPPPKNTGFKEEKEDYVFYSSTGDESFL